MISSVSFLPISMFLSPRRVSAIAATALTLFTIGTASAATNNFSSITLNAILLMFGGSISTSHNDVSSTQVCGTGPCAQSKTTSLNATTNTVFTVNGSATNTVTVIQQ